MVVAYQVLASPVLGDATDPMELSSSNALPSDDYANALIQRMLSNEDSYANFRQHFINKLSKRRAQAKANLAGLWGVPTRFA